MSRNIKKLPPISDAEKHAQRSAILTIMKILDVDRYGLADKLQISYALVSRWITGSARIAPISAVRLSQLVPEFTVQQLCPRAYKDLI